MRFIHACALAFSLTLLTASSFAAESTEPLTLDQTQGAAPLTVSITAPAELVQHLTGWQQRNRVHNKWGDGFFINWGDGTGDGDSAPRGGDSSTESQVGGHTFTKAGTYSVTAGLYRFMPDDRHKWTWHGQATVTVQAK